MRVSRKLYFLNEKISHAQKPQKVQKAQEAQKSTKHKQATFLLLDDFLLLTCFYVHKNAVFFVSHTKKHKKHIKSTKTQMSE